MTSNLPIVALVGLVAGVGGAGLTSTLLAPAPEAPAPALTANAPAVDLSGVEERLDRFASRLDELEMQVAAAPMRRDAAAPAAQEVDLSELRAELESYLTTLRNPQIAMPPHFEDWVATAQESIREREREEREAERAERMDQMLEDRLSEMSTKLGLDQSQLGQMRDVMTSTREASTKLMEDMRTAGWGPDSRDLMRAGMEEIRTNASNTLQGFLSPTQYESYQSEYGNDFGMGRGGFGNFGGNTGGRGGRGGRGN